MKLPDLKKGIIAYSLGSIILGGTGIFVRLAGTKIAPMTQSFGRIFFTFILISLFNLITKKFSSSFSIKKKHLPFFILNGLIGFSLMAASFTLAVLNTSMANTYFLLYTAPIFVVILSYLFLKEKIKSSFYISLLLSFIGLIFLFNPSNLTENLNGNFFGLLTGFGFGSYIVITRYLGRFYSPTTITFWTQLFGSIGLFPLIPIFDKTIVFSYSYSQWLPVLIAGLTVFSGYLLLNYGLKNIKAIFGSLLSLLEPLSSIVYGLLFFSEKLLSSTLLGSLLVIIALLYLTFQQTKKPTVST